MPDFLSASDAARQMNKAAPAKHYFNIAEHAVFSNDSLNSNLGIFTAECTPLPSMHLCLKSFLTPGKNTLRNDLLRRDKAGFHQY